MQKQVIVSKTAAKNLASMFVTIITFVALSGCASAPVPVNYAPSSVKTATGSLSVSEFKYLPAEPTAVKPVPSNLIRNTAMGEIKIDRDVKVLIRDAVFSELRFVGIKTNDPSKVLSGEIEEFAKAVWENLNPDNKVSLFVRYIDIETGIYESRIINKNC